MTAEHFDRPAIDRFVESWEQAFDRGEYEAMAAAYSDDAVLSGTGVPGMRGRAAILEFWRTACQGAKRAGIRRTIHADQFDSCGGLAYLQGTVALRSGDDTTVVWFVTVWKRVDGSEWRIIADTSSIVARADEPRERDELASHRATHQ